MRLVVCEQCHTQYDVAAFDGDTISCACGATVKNQGLTGRDAGIHRCGSCGAGLGEDPTRCGYCGSAVNTDTTKLSLVCPECYGRNEEASAYCTGCGIKFEPQEIPGSQNTLDCPTCDRIMTWRSIGGISVQECPGCNGLWVPGESFDKLLDRVVKNRHELPSAGLGEAAVETRVSSRYTRKVVYRKCPACGVGMRRKNFARKSGVIVDWCGQHGTWLDADELEEIADYIMAGGLEQAAGAETGAWRRADPDRLKALYESEKLMAAERVKEDRKRHLVFGDDIGSGTLRGLLSWIVES